MYTSIFQKFCRHIFYPVSFPCSASICFLSKVQNGSRGCYNRNFFLLSYTRLPQTGQVPMLSFVWNLLVSSSEISSHRLSIIASILVMPDMNCSGAIFSMFHQKRLIFPFGSHACGFQEVWKDLNQYFSIIGWKYLFSFTDCILGMDQLFDDSGSGCRSTQTLLFCIFIEFLISSSFHRASGVSSESFCQGGCVDIFYITYADSLSASA